MRRPSRRPTLSEIGDPWVYFDAAILPAMVVGLLWLAGFFDRFRRGRS
jgi:hypothetical protein